jgi:hypothetical protein
LNSLGAPDEKDVGPVKLLVGPGETLGDKELIVSENHEAVDVSQFDLNVAFYVSTNA